MKHDSQHNDIQHSGSVVLLSVVTNPFRLSVIMLNAVMLSVGAPQIFWSQTFKENSSGSFIEHIAHSSQSPISPAWSLEIFYNFSSSPVQEREYPDEFSKPREANMVQNS